MNTEDTTKLFFEMNTELVNQFIEMAHRKLSENSGFDIKITRKQAFEMAVKYCIKNWQEELNESSPEPTDKEEKEK